MLRAFVAGLAWWRSRNRRPHRLSPPMSWLDVRSSAALSKRSYGACLPSTTISCDRQRFTKAKAAENQIVYWSRLPSWKNQTLTPNPDAVYLMPFFNTRTGPMVLEIPPASDEGSITGDIDNAWQVPLEDVGPTGVDKGKGGKFLVLPPGYKDKVAPKGYTAVSSETYGGFALLRSILRGGTDADIAKAVAYGKRVKLYPLNASRKPACSGVRGRNKCGVRRHHSLRSQLLSVARSYRPDRALAGKGQSDD